MYKFMNFPSVNFTRYILERNHNQTQDDNYTIDVWVRQDFALLRWKNIRINFPCWNLLMFLQLYYVLWLRASFLLSVSCTIVEEVGGAQSRVRYSIKNEIEESAATKGNRYKEVKLESHNYIQSVCVATKCELA